MGLRLVSLVAALGLVGCAAQSTSSGLSTAVAHTSSTATATVRSATRAPAATPAEELSLITEPRDGIAPILSALASARRRVEMVMYEDEDAQIDAALAAAQQRGVSVHVLLDDGYRGEGSPQNAAAYSYLQAHGVAVRWTSPAFALTHQKTLVIDTRAYILTFNLTPPYYATSRDFGVIDTIPADVAAIERTFDADYDDQPIAPPHGEDLLWSPGSQAALVALISSAAGWVDIENEEMDSTAVEQALQDDARRGVDVRVTMTNSPSWTAAFARLAAARVHIRLYGAEAPLYIHAKMILTPAAAFIGSQNFSSASMNDNRELGIITTNAAIRASLQATFTSDYAAATTFTSGGDSTTAPGTTATSHSQSGVGTASCTLSASYDARYNDYDIYVHSDAPNTTVTVRDSAGHSASWHANSTGYADVYLITGGQEPGQTVAATIAGASCSTTL